MRSRLPILPILAVLAGASFGASSGLYIKSVHLSSLALAGFRMGVPFLFMVPIILRSRELLGPRNQRKRLWIASAVNAVRMLLFILAYKLTTVANAVVLLYLWPIFALVFDSVRFRRRPTAPQIGLAVLSFAGILVMNLRKGFALAPNDLLGSLAMILAAAGFATTVILFKDALAEVKETHAIYFQNAIGALVFLPFLGAELGKASLPEIGIGLAYGFSVGVAGFFCFFYAMKRLPVFQYGALAYAEVPIGMLLAVSVLGETMTAERIVGAVMVLAASFLAQRTRAREPRSRGAR